MKNRTFTAKINIRQGEFEHTVSRLLVADNLARAEALSLDVIAMMYSEPDEVEFDEYNSVAVCGGELVLSVVAVREIGLATFLEMRDVVGIPVYTDSNVAEPRAEDLDDLKGVSASITKALTAKQVQVTQSQVLNAVASAVGSRNWAQYKATKAAPAAVVIPEMPQTDDRRLGDETIPDGYLESDNEWIARNLDAVRWFIEHHAAIRATIAAATSYPGEVVQARPAGSDGWQAHAKDLEKQLAWWKERASTMETHQRGEVWYWQGDGQDHLESLVNSLPVVIRAEALRALITAPAVVIVPEGWKLVPISPTKAMQNAWDGAPFNEDSDAEFRGGYAALIAAAPAAPAATEEAALGAVLMQFIETAGSVQFQRLREGVGGPIRWDVEFGPYDDEARGKTLAQAVHKAIASLAKVN